MKYQRIKEIPEGNPARRAYIRVSTYDQNPARQLEEVFTSEPSLGCIYTDYASGSSLDRPALKELLQSIRSGDKIIVHSIDRLGRSIRDLFEIVDQIMKAGATITFTKQNTTYSEKDPISKLLFANLAAFAEFERDLIKERQLEGIQKAKQRGAYDKRRKELTPDQLENLLKKREMGFSYRKLACFYNVSHTTLKARLEEYLKTKKCIQIKP